MLIGRMYPKQWADSSNVLMYSVMSRIHILLWSSRKRSYITVVCQISARLRNVRWG